MGTAWEAAGARWQGPEKVPELTYGSGMLLYSFSERSTMHERVFAGALRGLEVIVLSRAEEMGCVMLRPRNAEFL